jgi:hypothetical protein
MRKFSPLSEAELEQRRAAGRASAAKRKGKGRLYGTDKGEAPSVAQTAWGQTAGKPRETRLKSSLGAYYRAHLDKEFADVTPEPVGRGGFKEFGFKPQKPKGMADDDYAKFATRAGEITTALRQPILDGAIKEKLIPEGTDPRAVRQAFAHARLVALARLGLGEYHFRMEDDRKEQMTRLTPFIRYAHRRLEQDPQGLRAQLKGQWKQFKDEFGEEFADKRKDPRTGEVRRRLYPHDVLVRADGGELTKMLKIPTSPTIAQLRRRSDAALNAVKTRFGNNFNATAPEVREARILDRHQHRAEQAYQTGKRYTAMNQAESADLARRSDFLRANGMAKPPKSRLAMDRHIKRLGLYGKFHGVDKADQDEMAKGVYMGRLGRVFRNVTAASEGRILRHAQKQPDIGNRWSRIDVNAKRTWADKSKPEYGEISFGGKGRNTGRALYASKPKPYQERQFAQGQGEYDQIKSAGMLGRLRNIGKTDEGMQLAKGVPNVGALRAAMLSIKHRHRLLRRDGGFPLTRYDKKEIADGSTSFWAREHSSAWNRGQATRKKNGLPPYVSSDDAKAKENFRARIKKADDGMQLAKAFRVGLPAAGGSAWGRSVTGRIASGLASTAFSAARSVIPAIGRGAGAAGTAVSRSAGSSRGMIGRMANKTLGAFMGPQGRSAMRMDYRKRLTAALPKAPMSSGFRSGAVKALRGPLRTRSTLAGIPRNRVIDGAAAAATVGGVGYYATRPSTPSAPVTARYR